VSQHCHRINFCRDVQKDSFPNGVPTLRYSSHGEKNKIKSRAIPENGASAAFFELSLLRTAPVNKYPCVEVNVFVDCAHENLTGLDR
jgi:hypothetical protein